MAAVDWKTKNRQSSEKALGPEQPIQNPAPWTQSSHTKAWKLDLKEESWTERGCPAHRHLPLKVAERYLADTSAQGSCLLQLSKTAQEISLVPATGGLASLFKACKLPARTKSNGAECPLGKLDVLLCATHWQGIGGRRCEARG